MKEGGKERMTLTVQSVDFSVLSTYLREALGNIRLVLAGETWKRSGGFHRNSWGLNRCRWAYNLEFMKLKKTNGNSGQTLSFTSVVVNILPGTRRTDGCRGCWKQLDTETNEQEAIAKE